jgi:hypothetical protein
MPTRDQSLVPRRRRGSKDPAASLTAEAGIAVFKIELKTVTAGGLGLPGR